MSLIELLEYFVYHRSEFAFGVGLVGLPPDLFWGIIATQVVWMIVGRVFWFGIHVVASEYPQRRGTEVSKDSSRAISKGVSDTHTRAHTLRSKTTFYRCGGS